MCIRDSDTLKIAKVVHADLPSRKLGALCEYYHIENVAAHRAYHDALATAKLYQSMAHFYEEKEPKVFKPQPLAYKVKKKEPITAKQIAFLTRLMQPVSYTHLRAHETGRNLVCRLLLEKKK